MSQYKPTLEKAQMIALVQAQIQDLFDIMATMEGDGLCWEDLAFATVVATRALALAGTDNDPAAAREKLLDVIAMAMAAQARLVEHNRAAH